MGVVAKGQELRIWSAIRGQGAHGATSKEATELTGIPHVSTSTMMAKMIARGLLAETTIERNGSRVRVATSADYSEDQPPPQASLF